MGLIDDNQDTIGLGQEGRLFIVLREDKDEDSHHLATQKGPQIITFKCHGNIDKTSNKIEQAGYKVRDNPLETQYAAPIY